MDAFVITRPTSGIGKQTALDLANEKRALILVGRDTGKLQLLKSELRGRCQIETVQCDLSDMGSCRRAASSIIEVCKTHTWRLRAIVNNAGLQYTGPACSAQGWVMTFAVNTLGTLVFLLPALPYAAQVLFVASKVKDPSQPLPRKAGLRGGRFISVEASARGIVDKTKRDGGHSKLPGADAYATSKQCILACCFALARKNPRLRINAVEAGCIPETRLGRDAPFVIRVIARYMFPLVTPFIDGASSVPKAAKLLCSIVFDSTNIEREIISTKKGTACRRRFWYVRKVIRIWF